VQRLLWATWLHGLHVTLCDKVDAIAVAGREADARHCASLSLLQAKISMGSQNAKKISLLITS
jgi:hypothetical protein